MMTVGTTVRLVGGLTYVVKPDAKEVAKLVYDHTPKTPAPIGSRQNP